MGVEQTHGNAIYVLSDVRRGEMIQEFDIEGRQLLIRTLHDYILETTDWGLALQNGGMRNSAEYLQSKTTIYLVQTIKNNYLKFLKIFQKSYRK